MNCKHKYVPAYKYTYTEEPQISTVFESSQPVVTEVGKKCKRCGHEEK